MAVPSAERIVGDYLRTDAGVAAITDRVVGKTPSNVARPWVRVTLIDDPPVDGGVTDRAVAAQLQIDCFAGTDGDQEDADDLRVAVREALQEIAGVRGSAVVTGARCSSSRVPDATFEPAMERYIVAATVWMHG